MVRYHENGTNMRLRTLLPWAIALAMTAQVQQSPPLHPRQDEPPEVRLPNGKIQRDEILKADYEKSLEESRELAKLADELKADLEKSDRYILSLNTIKKTEEIEKLAKRIRGRMKRF